MTTVWIIHPCGVYANNRTVLRHPRLTLDHRPPLCRLYIVLLTGSDSLLGFVFIIQCLTPQSHSLLIPHQFLLDQRTSKMCNIVYHIFSCCRPDSKRGSDQLQEPHETRIFNCHTETWTRLLANQRPTIPCQNVSTNWREEKDTSKKCSACSQVPPVPTIVLTTPTPPPPPQTLPPSLTRRRDKHIVVPAVVIPLANQQPPPALRRVTARIPATPTTPIAAKVPMVGHDPLVPEAPVATSFFVNLPQSSGQPRPHLQPPLPPKPQHSDNQNDTGNDASNLSFSDRICLQHPRSAANGWNPPPTSSSSSASSFNHEQPKGMAED